MIICSYSDGITDNILLITVDSNITLKLWNHSTTVDSRLRFLRWHHLAWSVNDNSEYREDVKNCYIHILRYM